MFTITKVLGHLAMPLPALLLLAFVAVAGIDGATGRILAGVALALLWLASTPALSRGLMRPLGNDGGIGDCADADPAALEAAGLKPASLKPASLKPADVVVVLSGGFPWRDLFALQLFQLGKAPLLLFSGRLSARSEAILRNLLDLTGTPWDQVLMETGSRNTAEGGTAFRALATARGWRSVLLVSSGYHLLRALHHYRCPGVRVRGVPCPEPGMPSGNPEGRARPLDQRLTDLIPHPHGLLQTYLALRERVAQALTSAGA